MAGAFDAALSFETLHHFPFEKKGTIYEKLSKKSAIWAYSSPQFPRWTSS